MKSKEHIDIILDELQVMKDDRHLDSQEASVAAGALEYAIDKLREAMKED